MNDDEMTTSNAIEEMFYEDAWGEFITYDELLGVSERKTNDRKCILGIDEGEEVRKMDYRIFNFLTYACSAPREIYYKMEDRYPDTCLTSGLKQVCEERMIERNIDEYSLVVIEDFMKAAAECARILESKGFSDSNRYIVQPHARILRLNYDVFGTYRMIKKFSGASHYRRTPVKPVKLVQKNNNTADALLW